MALQMGLPGEECPRECLPYRPGPPPAEALAWVLIKKRLGKRARHTEAPELNKPTRICRAFAIRLRLISTFGFSPSCWEGRLPTRGAAGCRNTCARSRPWLGGRHPPAAGSPARPRDLHPRRLTVAQQAKILRAAPSPACGRGARQVAADGAQARHAAALRGRARRLRSLVSHGEATADDDSRARRRARRLRRGSP